MNPVERAIRRVDATQQRFTPTAFIFGVVKKYGDDNGGVLVSNLAYSAFLSLFPLLLILVTILGLIRVVALGHGGGEPGSRAVQPLAAHSGQPFPTFPQLKRLL